MTSLAHTVYTVYTCIVLDWTGQRLTQMRQQYPAWDIWVVRRATVRQTVWCARPKGTPVATVNVGSPEELVKAIAEYERG